MKECDSNRADATTSKKYVITDLNILPEKLRKQIIQNLLQDGLPLYVGGISYPWVSLVLILNSIR